MADMQEHPQSRIASFDTGSETREFVVMTYNVNRFHLCDLPEKMRESSETVAEWSDEQLSVFHWNNRAPRIAKAIMANNADFVALEELRKMDTSSIHTLLGDPEIDKRYMFVEWKSNGTPMCMTNGLLYDHRKWFLTDLSMHWLSGTPDQISDHDEKGFGRVLGCAEFQPIDTATGKVRVNLKPLHVFVTHLAVFPESLKHKQVNSIASIIHEHCYLGLFNGPSQSDNVILMGDFNFFDDCEGGAMRKKLESHFDNVGKDAVFSQSRKVGDRTFAPYSYDPMFGKLQYTYSILDHIFVTQGGIERVGDAWLDTKTYCEGTEPKELSDWDARPSDHMPLCALLKVTFNPEK